MTRTLFVFIMFAAAISAAPPRKHITELINPDGLPMPAPINIVAQVPEAIIPALEEALVMNEFGTTGAMLVETATQYLGCKYGIGARGPKRFDCSGLTSWVYKLQGIELGRSSRDQYCDGVAVDATEAKPGDLVFFARGKEPSSIYHVGMVVDTDANGGFRFIHSARTGVRVDSSNDDYYSRHFFGMRRILSTEKAETKE